MASKKTVLSLLLGTAIATVLAAAPASATDNPFASAVMEKGYRVAAADGKCGGMKDKEGSCGGAKKSDKEGKCGGK